MNYGKAIKTVRALRNISQKELGIKTKLSKGYISKIENGIAVPSVNQLEEITTELKIPFYMLIFLSSEKGDLIGISEKSAEKLKSSFFDVLTSTETVKK